ncbi:MAG: VOC family protein [Bordetella sp.]|uniref:VOC family protein n=1 Tax=Bordetella sp. TaxID=28081 RepID=UPI003F7B647C
MSNPIPYLSFNGQCAEAMHFYERALDGRIGAMMRMGDAPAPHQVPPEAADLIMYADLVLPDGGHLYAGDCPPGMPYQGIQGVALAMNFSSTAQARRVFDALSENGQVIMAPQATFWAKEFSMCVDRFGTTWSLNGERLDA